MNLILCVSDNGPPRLALAIRGPNMLLMIIRLLVIIKPRHTCMYIRKEIKCCLWNKIKTRLTPVAYLKRSRSLTDSSYKNNCCKFATSRPLRRRDRRYESKMGKIPTVTYSEPFKNILNEINRKRNWNPTFFSRKYFRSQKRRNPFRRLSNSNDRNHFSREAAGRRCFQFRNCNLSLFVLSRLARNLMLKNLTILFQYVAITIKWGRDLE